MIDGKGLTYVIEQIMSEGDNDLARVVLDFFEKKAESIEDYDVLGDLSVKAKYFHMRLKCAEYCYVHATTSEQLYNARHNLQSCYNSLNYPEKALFYIEQNLKINPDDSDSLVEKSFNLSLMGKRLEAEQIIETLSKKDEKIAKNIDFSLSYKLLRNGETSRGLRGFNDTFKGTNPLFENKLKMKRWEGGAYPGKTIIINGEGGIGDEIINIRFMDYLKKLGMKPILYSSWNMYRPDIVDLFKRHGHDVVTTSFFFRKEYMWTHMMSIPGLLGLKEEQLWNGKYLKPLRNPKNKLKDNNKLRIGIKCNGNIYFEQDYYRSIPIDEMISAIPKEFSIYYFDKEKDHDGVISLKDNLNTWEDTLDYIDQMDVILSSCTSLPHASGAIGKKTIVCVPIAKYYTWVSTKTDNSTPWYGDNFTVLEQTTPRCWKEPLLKVNQLLREMI